MTCAPPPNTAPDTLCVLSAEGVTPADKDRIEFLARWDGKLWHSKRCAGISVRKATMCGFRFETIAPTMTPFDRKRWWSIHGVTSVGHNDEKFAEELKYRGLIEAYCYMPDLTCWRFTRIGVLVYFGEE